jgi:16S rRNA (cytidine1402-2'-O)-methyltransferase
MPTLYIVATPIGNLEDITLRALRILREVDAVLCEDTRVTTKLMQKYDIDKSLISYHAHSDLLKTEKIFDMLKQGKNLALVSDAGTPCISDPGALLVSKVRERFGDKVRIEPIPGACALITALSAVGMPVSDFLFLGFLPHKKGRNKLFQEIKDSKRTVVFYESPHRIIKTLDSLHCALSDSKRIVVARELTKIYEEFILGTAKEILEHLENNIKQNRGEFTVIIRNTIP